MVNLEKIGAKYTVLNRYEIIWLNDSHLVNYRGYKANSIFDDNRIALHTDNFIYISKEKNLYNLISYMTRCTVIK